MTNQSRLRNPRFWFNVYGAILTFGSAYVFKLSVILSFQPDITGWDVFMVYIPAIICVAACFGMAYFAVIGDSKASQMITSLGWFGSGALLGVFIPMIEALTSPVTQLALAVFLSAPIGALTVYLLAPSTYMNYLHPDRPAKTQSIRDLEEISGDKGSRIDTKA